MNAAARQLIHFDHSFKAELHTTSGRFFQEPFGVVTAGNRPVQLTLKGRALDIMEDVLTDRKFIEIPYSEVLLFNLFYRIVCICPISDNVLM